MYVAFNKHVSVTGTPLLALSTTPARSATYVDGTDGDAELGFRYTVQDGDTVGTLAYVNTGSLTLNGGTIQDVNGTDAVLDLPELDSPESLGGSGIEIDGVAPTVLSVTSPNEDDTYGVGDAIRIAVSFSEAVVAIVWQQGGK